MRIDWRRGGTWVCLLVVLHLVWGFARVPGRVWGHRLADIEAYRKYGAPAYFLDRGQARPPLRGADAVEWLLEHTPADAVVLWRGQTKGAFELASGLLTPRLLVHADAVAAGRKRYLGRPVGTGADGTAVLVGRGEDVVVEFR